jgi:EpsI family protein
MSESETVLINPAGGGPAFEANRYIIQNGDNRQLLIYWYQGRGRAVASEYWDKLYTVTDSVRRRRSDGAMVRVMMPIGSSEEKTLKAATELAAQVSPHLSGFVPE